MFVAFNRIESHKFDLERGRSFFSPPSFRDVVGIHSIIPICRGFYLEKSQNVSSINPLYFIGSVLEEISISLETSSVKATDLNDVDHMETFMLLWILGKLEIQHLLTGTLS